MRTLMAVALAATTGCGALDFDVTQALGEQTVKGDPIAATAGQLLSTGGLFPNPLSFDIDVQSETKAHNTGPARLLVLKSLTLEATGASPSQNFDFLDEVHVFVESRKEGSALSKVEVATLAPVPQGQSTLEFQVHPDVNLLPYVNEGTKVTTQAKARVPAKDVVFNGTAVFRVTPT